MSIGGFPRALHWASWLLANSTSRDPRVVATVTPHRSSSDLTAMLVSASAANSSLPLSVPSMSTTFSRTSVTPIWPTAASNRFACRPGMSESNVVGRMSSVRPSAWLTARRMSISQPATSPFSLRKSSGGEPSATATVSVLDCAMDGGSSLTRAGCTVSSKVVAASAAAAAGVLVQPMAANAVPMANKVASANRVAVWRVRGICIDGSSMVGVARVGQLRVGFWSQSKRRFLGWRVSFWHDHITPAHLLAAGGTGGAGEARRWPGQARP